MKENEVSWIENLSFHTAWQGEKHGSEMNLGRMQFHMDWVPNSQFGRFGRLWGILFSYYKNVKELAGFAIE